MTGDFPPDAVWNDALGYTWNPEPSSPTILTFQHTEPTYFIIKFETGEIRIDLKTGAVELEGVSVDEAALEFWKAVERLYPKK